MKKSLLILFASVLLVFNGNCQTQLGNFFFSCDQYLNITPDSIIDNKLNDPLDIGNKTNIIFISKTHIANYNPYKIIRMHFSLYDINNQYINPIAPNRFRVEISVLGDGGLISSKTFFLTSDLYNYDLTNVPLQIFRQVRVKVNITDLNFSVNRFPNPPYDVNTGYPLLQKFIIYNPLPEKRFFCNTATSNIYGFDNMDLASSTIYRDGQQHLSFQWTSSTGGTFTDIVGATNSNLTVSNVIVKSYYIRKAIYTTSTGVTTEYFSKDTLLILTPMSCGIFASNITGTTSISPNQTATYSVPATVGMQYVWTVIGGTITSGQGTNSITVLWDGGGSANLRTTVADYSVSVVETDATPTSKTTTQAITMTTTGINKGFASSGISVFPNPTKNQFTIEMPTANTAVNYTVYSTTGVQMQAGTFNAAASGNTITTQLPAGMYQLVLNYDGVFTSTRLVVSGQ